MSVFVTSPGTASNQPPHVTEHIAAVPLDAPPATHLPLSLLRSLRLVPAEVMSDVFVCLPFGSMEALGTACGVSDDAGWGMLLGYSLRYMWTEAMIRDLGPAVTPSVRGMVKGYTNGHHVSLPRRCTSWLELYRTVVLEMTYVDDLDSARSVRGTAILVLASATRGSHELRNFAIPPSVSWIGFEPNTNVTAIGYAFLYGCRGLPSVDLSSLSQVTTIGVSFLAGCSGLNLSILGRSTTELQLCTLLT